MPNKYIKEFLSLRCAGEILDILYPINKTGKELSEAMSIRKSIKGMILQNPDQYSVIDLCSGNALLPVLTSFTLPTKMNIAIDKYVRDREWSRIRKFKYVNLNISSLDLDKFAEDEGCGDVILTSIHACNKLAKHIIALFQSSKKAKHLFLMPCCEGKLEKTYSLRGLNFPRYVHWSMELALGLDVNTTTIKRDPYVISPKNIIIYSRKEEK
jgi:hypothetical protein